MTLVNHVAQIQAECTKCGRNLVAMNGDIIIIYPQIFMKEWQLIVLCRPCYEEVEGIE